MITIFFDNPDEIESNPIRVLNGNGNLLHKGHEGDISTVAFHDPFWLATGSVDGVIVVFNIEAGTIRFTLREPYLKLRSQEEKAVEKILFLDYKDSLYIVSCHGDGYIRFWNMSTTKMENEVNIQIAGDEGLTVMGLDNTSEILVVGGSQGHARVMNF